MGKKLRTPWLVFIDTNVFLDFYRLSGETALRQLAALKRHTSRLILTEQVHMEFLKHRQRVVMGTMAELKKPTEQKLPPVLAYYQEGQTFKRQTQETVGTYRKLKEKANSIILKPETHDDVFKALKEIFAQKTEHHLHRTTENKLQIRSRARKRFILGYPPRKANDTSMGDSVNWEWIIHCATTCKDKSNVIVVSRDGDYGLEVERSKWILNDWLKMEFKERVSARRELQLTPRLSDALRFLDESVPRRDAMEEESVISNPVERVQVRNLISAGITASVADALRNFSPPVLSVPRIASGSALENLNLDTNVSELVERLMSQLSAAQVPDIMFGEITPSQDHGEGEAEG